MLVSLYPKYPLALFNLGCTFMELGLYRAALETTRTSYDLDPEYKECVRKILRRWIRRSFEAAAGRCSCLLLPDRNLCVFARLIGRTGKNFNRSLLARFFCCGTVRFMIPFFS